MDVRNVPSTTDNPYWEIVKKIPSGIAGKMGLSDRWHPRWDAIDVLLDPHLSEEDKEEIFNSSPRRDNLVRAYAWAIPDPLTLEFFKQNIPLSSSIVEYGAGTGYWAWQLTQLGFQVDALDKHVGGTLYHPVRAGDESNVSDFGADTLLICWPDGSGSTARALKNFQGSRVIYIGEGSGGCNAGEDFFEELSTKWQLTQTHSNVTFESIKDRVWVYTR